MPPRSSYRLVAHHATTAGAACRRIFLRRIHPVHPSCGQWRQVASWAAYRLWQGRAEEAKVESAAAKRSSASVKCPFVRGITPQSPEKRRAVRKWFWRRCQLAAVPVLSSCPPAGREDGSGAGHILRNLVEGLYPGKQSQPCGSVSNLALGPDFFVVSPVQSGAARTREFSGPRSKPVTASPPISAVVPKSSARLCKAKRPDKFVRKRIPP